MPTTAFALAPATGRPLRGLLDLPDQPGPHPVVVIAHGFKGFQEWGFFPPLAALLCERGFAVVRFNFSGSGMQPGDELVSDPAAFRDNTYAKELEDLLVVLGALGAEIGAGELDLTRLGLFGHSRGGGAAILAGAHEEWGSRLRAIATWAAISTIARTTPEQLAEWRRLGEMPVANARTGQQLALGPAMLEEVSAPPAHLDIQAAAGRVRPPWLVVHGDRDESVSIEEGFLLHGLAPKGTELVMIEGGGHTFGAVHPFASPTPHLIQAMNATQRWFLRQLA
jgi:uncharacterized protein